MQTSEGTHPQQKTAIQGGCIWWEGVGWVGATEKEWNFSAIPLQRECIFLVGRCLYTCVSLSFLHAFYDYLCCGAVW